MANNLNICKYKISHIIKFATVTKKYNNTHNYHIINTADY